MATPPDDRRSASRALMLAALLLVACAAAADLYRWLRRPPAAPSPQAVGPLFGEIPRQPLGGRRTQESPAPVGPSLAPPRLTGEDLLSFLLGNRGGMESMRFASDFMAKPELAAAWRRFKEDDNAERLVETLRASEAFKEVLAKSSALPGFKKALDKAAGHPAAAQLFARIELSRTAPGPGAAAPTPQAGTEAHGISAALAQIGRAQAGTGRPTVFEQRLLDELPADLMERLKAEMAKGKTLRQACAGLEFGQDCERLPLKHQPAAKAARGGPLTRGAPKRDLDADYAELKSTGTAAEKGPGTAAPAEGEPPPIGAGGEPPCSQWKQTFVFQCCNVAYCSRCESDQIQNTFCDPSNWAIVSADCGELSEFCLIDPLETTGAPAEAWQELFGKPKPLPKP